MNPMMFKALVLVLLFTSTASTAGTVEGNGADVHPESQHMSWFVGPQPIRVCIEQGEGFLVGASLRDALAFANSSWQRFFNRSFERDTLLLPANLEIQAHCDATTELTVYAGVTNEEVEKVLVFYNNPLAFVHQQSYDYETGRSKGFIWLSPNLGRHYAHGTSDQHLYDVEALMLHELGHVFGATHTHGTIMRPDLASYLIQTGYPAIPKIEFNGPVYWEASGIHFIRLAMDLSSRKVLDQKTWQRLNLKDSPTVFSTLSIDIHSGVFDLRISRDLGGRTEAVFEPFGPVMRGDVTERKIFNRYLQTADGLKNEYKTQSSHVQVGRVRFANGESYSAIVTMSFTDKVQLVYFDDAKVPHLLFQGDKF